MSKTELAEIARRQGLPATAALIEEFHTPELFARAIADDARLAQTAHADPLSILTQMVRRGLHQDLVRALWSWTEKRPLERALLAWDTLATTLISDDAWLAELRHAAAVYRQALPPPGKPCIDLNRHPVEKLIPGGLTEESPVMLMAMANDHSLAALSELLRRQDPLPKKSGTAASLMAIGRVLHLAHAPTLAAVYQDYLSRTLAFRPAARDLTETMFDMDAAERLPRDAVRPGDLPPELISDHAEYLTYRSYLPLVAPQQLDALIEENQRKRPPRMPAPSVQVQVVRAHVNALLGKPPPLAPSAFDQICDENKTWRYAARVRVVVCALTAGLRSPRPLGFLHDYFTAFGHDRNTAGEALQAGPAEAAWKQELLPLLCREARALPHEPGVWRAMILMISSDRARALAAVEEMQSKMDEQSRL
jgi:hypothetical protein